MKSLEEFFEKNYSTPLFYGFKQKFFFHYLKSVLRKNHISNFSTNKSLLTIGFGHMKELNLLKKTFNCRITAIDIFKKKLLFYARELKRNNSFSLFQKDVNEIDFEANYFQTVFAKDIFCFVEDADAFFNHLKSIIEKKGYLILNLDIFKERQNVDKHFNYEQYNHYKLPVKLYSVEDTLVKLKQHGFNVLVKELRKEDYFILAQKR